MTKELSSPTPSVSLVIHMKTTTNDNGNADERTEYGPYLHVDGYEFMAIRDDDGWTFRRID